MAPIDAVVREAALQSFSATAAAPNAAPFPPSAWDAYGQAEAPKPPHLLLSAEKALARALFAAYSAGLDPSLVYAAATAAGLAYAATRIRDRVAASVLHNDKSGRRGPQVLLPLPDDVLVHLINRLHSDR